MQPIPSYDEAVASKPPEPLSLVPGVSGPGDALLGARRPVHPDGDYHAPTVRSARSSEDSDLWLSEMDDDDSDEEPRLRREMEEMDTEDPQSHRRAQQRAWLPKSIGRISHTFTSWRRRLPTPDLSFITSRLPPDSPYDTKPTWSIFVRLFVLLSIVGLVYALMATKIFSTPLMIRHFLPEQIRSYAQAQVSREKIESYLYEITYDDHLAGTKGDYFLADWVGEKFKEAKLDGVYNDK